MAYMIEGGGSKTQVIIQTFQNYVVDKFDFKGMRCEPKLFKSGL